ncbi:MAG: cytidine deaminase [Gemmatimonadaceae bacterium]
MTDTISETLAESARTAMLRAYAPYSNFRVGAALRGEDGSVAIGCNVENASYPAGICAERAAIANAVANGQRHFTHLVIVTEADTPTPPCGMCRQVLIEFLDSDGDMEVVSIAHDGTRALWRLRDLAPTPFTPESLTQHR